ncbi:hypothetical protein DFJ74DRAFT_656157 [Hyaloraphidium curvatum]|nr:hypothetical protein DFJ74DRAFT_656157 [Hyaloraphidium curvatum]
MVLPEPGYDVFDIPYDEEFEIVRPRRRERSLSITISSNDLRAPLSDSGFGSEEDNRSEDEDDEEAPSKEEEEEEEEDDPPPRSRGTKRARSVSADAASVSADKRPSLPDDERVRGYPKNRLPKPFFVLDHSGRTVRVIQQTAAGPVISEVLPDGTSREEPMDMSRFVPGGDKAKKNALVLGMFYCDPQKFGNHPIGSAAIRDSVRLLELELDYNVYSVDREHTTRDSMDRRHFKIDLSNGIRAARSLKSELKERGLSKVRFSVVIGDYFRLPADCLNRLYTRGLFLKFFTAMYDERLLTSNAEFYLPNAPRIRENMHDLDCLYRITPIPGSDNPLFVATERAPLPDRYNNVGETRALDDTHPFLLLEILDSALEKAKDLHGDSRSALERTFASQLNPRAVPLPPPPKPRKSNGGPGASSSSGVNGKGHTNGTANGKEKGTKTNGHGGSAANGANGKRAESPASGSKSRSRLVLRRGKWVRVPAT